MIKTCHKVYKFFTGRLLILFILYLRYNINSYKSTSLRNSFKTSVLIVVYPSFRSSTSSLYRFLVSLHLRAIWLILLDTALKSLVSFFMLSMSSRTIYPSTAIFLKYALLFFVPASSIFFSISAASSGVTLK